MDKSKFSNETMYKFYIVSKKSEGYVKLRERNFSESVMKTFDDLEMIDNVDGYLIFTHKNYVKDFLVIDVNDVPYKVPQRENRLTIDDLISNGFVLIFFADDENDYDEDY